MPRDIVKLIVEAIVCWFGLFGEMVKNIRIT
jgi:hypothetical protein